MLNLYSELGVFKKWCCKKSKESYNLNGFIEDEHLILTPLYITSINSTQHKCGVQNTPNQYKNKIKNWFH